VASATGDIHKCWCEALCWLRIDYELPFKSSVTSSSAASVTHVPGYHPIMLIFHDGHLTES
jgi:hypothetical protein